jgi:predicted TIM-barrel fold metal-dependent hydrolase
MSITRTQGAFSPSVFAKEKGGFAVELPPTAIFDAHLHIIDRRFPLVPNQGFLPEEFTCRDYRERLKGYPLAGGAIVSGSFQAFDQTYLRAALLELGPAFVGVTQLPATVADDDILELAGAGVRAVRFNLKRGGSEEVAHLDRLARRVFDLAKWHVELYVDARELPNLEETLVSLPAVSIDHLGLSREGLPHLLRLVERGVKVKATGFGRVDFDVRQALATIYGINPKALMFGTDLPSTRAPRPYRDEDLLLMYEVFGEEGAGEVLSRNAMEFYRIVLPVLPF